MRLFPAILLCTTIATGGAQASSLLVLGEAEPVVVAVDSANRETGGSIAFANEPATPPEGFVSLSPSIIAMEEYEPVVDPAEIASASDASPEREDEGASIVAFAAEPASPPEGYVAVSPSVIAMEEYEPPVTDEMVAAIPKSVGETETEEAAPRRRFDPAPMVIRGGIVGDAFARSLPAQGEAAEEEVAQDGEASASGDDALPGTPPMPEEPGAPSPILDARRPE